MLGEGHEFGVPRPEGECPCGPDAAKEERVEGFAYEAHSVNWVEREEGGGIEGIGMGREVGV